ncbi:unnamed protein product [Rhizoctonia solani]|uniref:DUSP domain-containing protein n=1 Tax=Rhizoctonia solani TaxID=456999 RepID=A0A8H3HWN9_9AGAM|nr:unnamed protein product [Rhizoctonia solani]
MGTRWYCLAQMGQAMGGGDGGSAKQGLCEHYDGILWPCQQLAHHPPGTRRLLPELELNTDYEIIPDAAWEKLVQWYGQPINLPRKVITYSNEDRIEVYQHVFRVYPPLPAPFVPSHIEILSLETLSTLTARAAASIQVAGTTYRVWNVPATTHLDISSFPWTRKPPSPNLSRSQT